MGSAKNIKALTIVEFDIMEKAEDFKYQLLDGTVLMSPRPSYQHQKIMGNLYFQLRTLLEEKPCDVMTETEVLFDEKNCLVPDIFVQCSEQSVIDRFQGCPELVIEILSPSTMQYDRFAKLNKYAGMGVKEYWIVSPKSKSITLHNFDKQETIEYVLGDSITSKLLLDKRIELNDIFTF